MIQLRLKAPTDEVVAQGRGFRALGTTFVVNDDVSDASAARIHRAACTFLTGPVRDRPAGLLGDQVPVDGRRGSPCGPMPAT